MKIFYDGVIYLHQIQNSVNRLFEELSARIPAVNSGGEVYFHKFPSTFGTALIKRDHYMLSGIGPILKKLDTCLLPGTVNSFRPDIFHTSFYRVPESINCPSIVTVCDMEAEKYPDTTNFGVSPDFLKMKRGAMEKADRIIAVSSGIRRDISDIYSISEDKISVVYPAASDTFMPASDDEKTALKSKYGLQDRFILFVGKRSGYKNFSTLIKAYARWENNREIGLVCIGPKWNTAEIEIINVNGLGNKIRLFEFVSDNELKAFYSFADAFVHTSKYEGFSTHLVEALACGTPVIAASCSSSPEIAIDAAQYFDPESEEELIESLDKAIFNKKLQKSMSERGLKRKTCFSWDKTAWDTFEVYKKLLHG